MPKIPIPAERIDRKLRELADLWQVGWGELGIKGDSVLELLRVAYAEILECLPLDSVPTGLLFQGTYPNVHGVDLIEKARKRDNWEAVKAIAERLEI